MKIDFPKKQIKSYKDIQNHILHKVSGIALGLCAILVFLMCCFTSLTKFVFPIFAIDLIILIILWIPSSKISTAVNNLKRLQCNNCKHILSMDDLVEYTADAAILQIYSNTYEVTKKEYKNASVQELAARKYLGQEVTDTKTSSGSYYKFKGYALFKCPQCGEIHKVETKRSLTTSGSPTNAEKEKEVQKYFEKNYFPKLRTLEFK